MEKASAMHNQNRDGLLRSHSSLGLPYALLPHLHQFHALRDLVPEMMTDLSFVPFVSCAELSF